MKKIQYHRGERGGGGLDGIGICGQQIKKKTNKHTRNMSVWKNI